LSVPLGRIDHVVITAGDLARSLDFYQRVLGGLPDGPPHRVDGAIGAQRLLFSGFVLSVHQAEAGVAPVAAHPTVGGLDVCFRWDAAIATAVTHLAACGVDIVEGPVPRRTSEGGPATSVYFRDPDGNLLELLAPHSG
jgi:catechol 2,3-dioxygenase-like lactoylglutathione lyase family enzyme